MVVKSNISKTEGNYHAGIHAQYADKSFRFALMFLVYVINLQIDF